MSSLTTRSRSVHVMDKAMLRASALLTIYYLFLLMHAHLGCDYCIVFSNWINLQHGQWSPGGREEEAVGVPLPSHHTSSPYWSVKENSVSLASQFFCMERIKPEGNRSLDWDELVHMACNPTPLPPTICQGCPHVGLQKQQNASAQRGLGYRQAESLHRTGKSTKK
jgi:hypothetical protein